MGNSAAARGGLEAFASALRRQLADKQRVVRVFDVGGSGVKTGLVAAPSLQEFLQFGDQPPDAEVALNELEWIEPPNSLGRAPGEDGFPEWLLSILPRLRREADDPRVVFGVSIGGDVDHSTGRLNDWWPGGGYPQTWDDGRRSPRVAVLMGLPPDRTFAIHDGEAHLLGCSRRATPPPGLACLAIGTGVGLGLTDSEGAVVNPCSPSGRRSLCLNGVPLSGAAYRGTWQKWLDAPDCCHERAEAVMAQEFATMARPWRMPWTSLVLGRRGMELAEAAHNCPAPDDPGASVEAREPAVRAYAEQWLHFMHTQFVPQLVLGTRRHPVQKVCFAGGLVERNWPLFSEVLLEADSDHLRAPTETPGVGERSGSKRGRAAAKSGAGSTKSASESLVVLPPAPEGSGLIGAAIYALAGAGGASGAIWAP